MTVEPHPYVLYESDAELETWDDERGKISFRTTGGANGCVNGTFTSGIANLEPGGWLGLHHHSPAEMYYILDGKGVVTLGDTEYEVSAGATVFIPSNLPHGIRNTGDAPLRSFYTFAVAAFDDIEYHFH